MTAREYLTVLRRSWRLLLVTLLLGLGAAGAAIRATPREYSASVTFYITTQTANATSTDAYEGSLLSQDRVKSYTQLLTSYRVVGQVVRDLHLTAKPTDIAREISTSVTPNTVLLTASVTDHSPQRARAIAGSVATIFPTLVATLEKPAGGGRLPTVAAQVVQGPLLAGSPVSPRPAIYLLVGGVAGLLAGVCIAVLRPTLDRRIRTVADLRAVVPAPLLGTVLRDRSVGKRPLFLRDRPRAAIAESLRAVRTNLEIFGTGAAGCCYVVTSAVGGEGTSVLVANLALAEAAAGHRVLVVEADLRRPRAAGYLGVRSETGLTQVLSGEVALADAVAEGPVPRLSCLPSGVLPPDPYEVIHSARMPVLLAEARRRYDTVLVDAPPLLPVADGLELARRSDGVLLVVRAGKAPAPSIARAYDLLVGAGIGSVAVVLNAAAPADAGVAAYAGYYGSQDRRPVPEPTTDETPAAAQPTATPAEDGAGDASAEPDREVPRHGLPDGAPPVGAAHEPR